MAPSWWWLGRRTRRWSRRRTWPTRGCDSYSSLLQLPLLLQLPVSLWVSVPVWVHSRARLWLWLRPLLRCGIAPFEVDEFLTFLRVLCPDLNRPPSAASAPGCRDEAAYIPVGCAAQDWPPIRVLAPQHCAVRHRKPASKMTILPPVVNRPLPATRCRLQRCSTGCSITPQWSPFKADGVRLVNLGNIAAYVVARIFLAQPLGHASGEFQFR